MNNENFNQKRRIPPPPPPRPTNLQKPVGNINVQAKPVQTDQPNQVNARIVVPPRPAPQPQSSTQNVSVQKPQIQEAAKPAGNTVANNSVPITPQTKPQPKPPVKEKQTKPVKIKAPKKEREPLSDQSKTILFGLLGVFFLLGGVTLLVLMFLL